EHEELLPRARRHPLEQLLVVGRVDRADPHRIASCFEMRSKGNASESEAQAQERCLSPNLQRPIVRLLDLLGRRWTLRVLWELRDGGAFTFRVLQERCGGLSSSVLNARLAELRDAGIVERAG